MAFVGAVNEQHFKIIETQQQECAHESRWPSHATRIDLDRIATGTLSFAASHSSTFFDIQQSSRSKVFLFVQRMMQDGYSKELYFVHSVHNLRHTDITCVSIDIESGNADAAQVSPADDDQRAVRGQRATARSSATASW